MDGWLNLYKPRGISSAKAVALVKRHFKGCKIGHTGTLDLEAEGVLPIAIGQATKLVSIIMDAKKQYLFTVQFGAGSTTGDAAGKIIKETTNIPSEAECLAICAKFRGQIEQTPPAYSALKISGVRAYKLARENKIFEIKKRIITIYDLKLLSYDGLNKRATYLVDCSKGTYIRTLAEDISLSLQSLGFVIELRRTKVGIFNEENSVSITDLDSASFDYIKSKCLKTRSHPKFANEEQGLGAHGTEELNVLNVHEDPSTGATPQLPLAVDSWVRPIEIVLDDIPVLEVDRLTAKKVRFGQICEFENSEDYDQIWLKHNNKILAIGSLDGGSFKSSRVFNYIENGE